MKPIELPDGWHIEYNPKPIPDFSHDYDFWHDDSDDCNNLHGTAKDPQDAFEQILEIEAEKDAPVSEG